MISAFVLAFAWRTMLALYRLFGTTISPTFKDCLTLGVMVDSLSRNVSTELQFYAAYNPERAQISSVHLQSSAGCSNFWRLLFFDVSCPTQPTCKSHRLWNTGGTCNGIIGFRLRDLFWRNSLSVGICYWNGRRTGIKYTHQFYAL